MTDFDNEPRRSVKWHESLATVLIVAIFAVIVTSPCWGIALLKVAAK